MAIAFDAVSQGNGGASASSFTQAHTCTGSNLILIVWVLTRTTGDTLTGVTYNSVAMTKVGTSQLEAGTRYLSQWYLINPATGANNIVASRSESPASNITIAGISYTGAKQSGQPDASGQSTPSGTTTDQAVTVVADNCWLACAYSNGPASPNGVRLNGAAGGVSRDTNFPNSEIGHMDSNAVVVAGARSVGFSWGSSQSPALQALSIAPAAAAAPSVSDIPTVTESVTGYPYFPVSLGINPDLPHKGPEVWGG